MKKIFFEYRLFRVMDYFSSSTLSSPCLPACIVSSGISSGDKSYIFILILLSVGIFLWEGSCFSFSLCFSEILFCALMVFLLVCVYIAWSLLNFLDLWADIFMTFETFSVFSKINILFRAILGSQWTWAESSEFPLIPSHHTHTVSSANSILHQCGLL